MQKNNIGIVLATMAGLLFSNTVFSKPTAHNALVKCVGANSCKGKSACQTANSACKGMNNCKGKGYIMTSLKHCKQKGGKVDK